MRSTIIIEQRGAGYISTVSDRCGGGHQGARAGFTPYDAAATAARYMIEYAQCNPDGGDLMAPPEVLDLVPEHLRSIAGLADANARLLAAAPDLLATLEIVLADANSELDYECALIIRAAIAKATGAQA